ncbi:MAG: hypothetical protein IPI49_10355 [Myxococcales bacterium]|nr:hypothetical protein [Myxococcales bacterium]
MVRAAGVAVAIALAWPALSAADAIEDRVHELASDDNYKLRLASTLALSKSSDPRALRALGALLDGAAEKSLRRIAVLGLAKRLPDASSALRAELLQVIERAARRDRDAKVRAAAARAAKQLAALAGRASPPSQPATAGTARPTDPGAGPAAAGTRRDDAPRVFVRVNLATDATRTLGAEPLAHVTGAVRRSVTQLGFATSWPGALPTSADLRVNSARAFLVAVTVKKVEVKRPGKGGAEISCAVSIMITPWHGVDGKELWEAERAASAAGSARAETGTSAKDIASGTRDCIEAVTTEVTSRHVAPFLRRLSSN